MSEGLITDQGEFDELCVHIRESGIVAFDTEFISESTYRPKLCLIQLAPRERCGAVGTDDRAIAHSGGACIERVIECHRERLPRLREVDVYRT